MSFRGYHGSTTHSQDTLSYSDTWRINSQTMCEYDHSSDHLSLKIAGILLTYWL